MFRLLQYEMYNQLTGSISLTNGCPSLFIIMLNFHSSCNKWPWCLCFHWWAENIYIVLKSILLIFTEWMEVQKFLNLFYHVHNVVWSYFIHYREIPGFIRCVVWQILGTRAAFYLDPHVHVITAQSHWDSQWHHYSQRLHGNTSYFWLFGWFDDLEMWRQGKGILEM